jgi:hypothetical protein
MKKVYDGEAELVKARLGLRFRCAICGKLHDPTKNAWRRCSRAVDVRREVCLTPPLPSSLRIRKGMRAEKIWRYYEKTVTVWESIFELLTTTKRVKERYRRALELGRVFNQVFLERVERLPDVQLRVDKCEKGDYNEITSIWINGEEYDSRRVLELFTSPAGLWEKVERASRSFRATTYSIYMVSDDLSHIVVQQRRSEYVGSEIVSLKKRYYLLSQDGKIAELTYGLRRLKKMDIKSVIAEVGW